MRVCLSVAGVAQQILITKDGPSFNIARAGGELVNEFAALGWSVVLLWLEEKVN